MRVQFVIPVLASIMILGSLGLSQIVIGQTTINNLVDLSITKTADVDFAVANDTVIFTIDVFNDDGPSVANNVIVNDTLPAAVRFVSDDSGGAYNTTTNQWAAGSIPVGGFVTLKINVTVNEGFGGKVDNIAQITSSSIIDDEPSNDSDTGSFVIPELIQVDIDVKPTSNPSCFNSDGKGVIPVAILGSAGFDVSTIDPATILLDGQGVKTKGNGAPHANINDFNRDGFPDLIVKIIDGGIYTQENTIAQLTGQLFDGTSIEGTTSICVTQ